jgi:hypothetical protein
MTALGQQGLSPAEPPFGRYVASDDGGFPGRGRLPCRPVRHGRRARRTRRDPGGTVAYTIHTRAYDGVGAAYAAAATDWLADNGFVVSGKAWESYLDGPEVRRCPGSRRT